MNHNYEITYKNVRLCPLSEKDIENLRVWRNDEGNSKYLRKIPYITPDGQRNWFDDYLKNEDEFCFSIIENQNLKRVVGSLSLYNFHEDSCEFGKILIGDNEAHGRRIGVNAAVAETMIAFSEIHLKIYD